MNILEKIQENIVSEFAKGLPAAIIVLLCWIFYQIGPIILPLIENNIPNKIILSAH
jgi:hypothetical protein